MEHPERFLDMQHPEDFNGLFLGLMSGGSLGVGFFLASPVMVVLSGVFLVLAAAYTMRVRPECKQAKLWTAVGAAIGIFTGYLVPTVT